MGTWRALVSRRRARSPDEAALFPTGAAVERAEGGERSVDRHAVASDRLPPSRVCPSDSYTPWPAPIGAAFTRQAAS